MVPRDTTQVRRGSCHLCLISRQRKIRCEREPTLGARRLPRCRRFESCSLQRQVTCEPEPGAAEIGSGENDVGGDDADAGLCHGNSIEHILRANARYVSCRCDGILPLCSSFGPEDPQCGSGDEVALEVEGVVNRTVHAEEALGRSS